MKTKFVPQNKIHFTPEMDSFLVNNYEKMTNPQLAQALGLNLTRTRTRLYELGFKRMELEYWTAEQVQYLKENYQRLGDTEIAEIFNQKYAKQKGWSKKHIEKKRRYLKLKRSESDKKTVFERNVNNGRFAVCVKKRWETTGQNALGTVVVWRINGYDIPFVKTDKGYIKVAHANWIKANGAINKGSNIIHKDLNTLNCELDNLICVSHTEKQQIMLNSDKRMAWNMASKDKNLQQELLKHPELLELKRNQLTLNKLINESIG